MNDPSFYKFYYLSGELSNGKFIELDGINNLSIERSLSFNNQFVLGGAESAYQINAPQEVNLSFDRSFVQMDPLLSFTGVNPIEKTFVYNGCQYYELTNLYLTNYNAAFSVGDLPKISTKFSSFGHEVLQSDKMVLSKIGFAQLPRVSGATLVPKLNSISINALAYSSGILKNNHNIYGFDYSIASIRTPSYTVGSLYPNNVSTMLPYQIAVNINSKVSSNYKNDKMPSFSNLNESYLDFDLEIKVDNSLMSFPVRKAKLISTSVEMASQNTLEIRRSFIGTYGL